MTASPTSAFERKNPQLGGFSVAVLGMDPTPSTDFEPGT